jgi:hypothetical protein
MNLGLLGTASKIHTISIFGSSVALVPTRTGRDEQPADGYSRPNGFDWR